MKTATVTAYINTGFSGINVPDSPALLENNAQRKQLSVINCLPLSGQVNVSIRVKDYPELHETDYIKLEFSGDNTTYWAKVDGYVYLSSDTVEISLIMDYWLTLGGIGNVSSISGMTKRVHIPKANDTLFAYTEPDEMINPAKPLKTESYSFTIGEINHSPILKDVKVVLCTLDLYAIGKAYNSTEGTDLKTAQTLVDGNGGSVTIPRLWHIGELPEDDPCWTTWGVTFPQKFSDNTPIPNPLYGGLLTWVPNPQNENDYGTITAKALNLPNVGYFDGDDSTVQRGISILHECGVEDAILDQYLIPREYVDDMGIGNTGGRIYLESPNSNGIFSVDTLKYKYGNYTPRNNKVFSGSTNAYTLFAKANADNESYNPENLYLQNTSPQTEPMFRMIADLRKTGGAMCMPLSLNNNIKNWYTNFVKEMEFQTAPINFQVASGSTISNALMGLKLNTQKAKFQEDYPLDGNNYNEAFDILGQGVRAGSAIAGGAVQMANGNLISGGGNVLGGFLDLGVADLTYDAYQDLASKRKATYKAQVSEEKIGMDLKNTYVAPQIKFQQSQTLRELVGNGFIIIKYQMSDEDLERCDRLLTMYGYRHSKVLEKTDLTNRPDFNYIEAGEVHITTNVGVPKWVREGAEDQLVGVRLWHKMFDISSYEGNE